MRKNILQHGKVDWEIILDMLVSTKSAKFGSPRVIIQCSEIALALGWHKSETIKLGAMGLKMFRICRSYFAELEDVVNWLHDQPIVVPVRSISDLQHLEALYATLQKSIKKKETSHDHPKHV